MRRCSAPGADGITWAQYRRDLDSRLSQLGQQLRDGTWKSTPVRLVEITTYAGKTFTAVVPSVEDRIVHRAIRNVLDAILEAGVLCDWVSGYRPGRNRLTALRQASVFTSAGYQWIADIDVAGAAAGGDVDLIIDWIARYVQDGSFLAVIRTILSPLPSPLVPGTGLSPTLLNLRLAQVDLQLNHLKVVRFADNYVAFTRDKNEADEAFKDIAEALLIEGLSPHEGKSRVRPAGTTNIEALLLIWG